MKVKDRSHLWIALVFVVFVGLLLLSGLRLYQYIRAKSVLEYIDLRGDNVNDIPVGRSLTTLLNPNDKFALNLNKLEFEVPRIDTQFIKRIDSNSILIQFKDGSMLSITENIHAVGIPDLKEYPGLVKELDQNNIKTKYDFEKFLFNKTSEDFNPYVLKRNLLQEAVCIKMKTVYQMRGARSAWYFFEVNDIRGFQYCEPNQCGEAFVEIFTFEGEEFTLITKNISQDEIDYILNSINTFIDK